jgi:hypothetical protein
MKAIARSTPVVDKNEEAKEEKKSKKKKSGGNDKSASVDSTATATPSGGDPNSSWTSTAAKTVDNSAALQVDTNAFYDPALPDETNMVSSDSKGLTANFKQDDGNWTGDGSAFTVPVMSYSPNDFGIYCMSGNVAEWTRDAYSPSTFAFVSDVNPVLLFDADSTAGEPMRRKVVRGGSFNSPAKDLSPYARTYELQETAHCYVGFRCVMGAPEILNKLTATRKKTKKK